MELQVVLENKNIFWASIVFLARVIAVPVIILAAPMIFFAGLNYSGFCFREMRYLTDEMKIRSVFKEDNEATTVVNEHGKTIRRYIPYRSFEEFIKRNPNCCQINPGGPYELPPPYFLDRITGYYSGDIIVLNYKVRYQDEDGEIQIKEVEYLNALMNCGGTRW
jgi:hypothetical protein